MLKFAGRARVREEQRWRRVEAQLRAEAEAARQPPARDLRRRTLVALGGASLEPRPASPRERQGWVTLAAAGVALALLASVAVTRRDEPAAPGPTQQVAPRDTITETEPDQASRFAIVIGVDTSALEAAVQRQMQRMEGTWAAPLLAEARLIVDDAREAGELVVNRLPVPPVRIERTRPKGTG